MKYIKGLDTMRAFAVFFVITDKYHWGPDFKENPALANLKTALIPDGRFGVNLFFVLSGFLITAILLHEKTKQINGNGDKITIIKNFFIRRVFRIFPIYYLTVFICCLLKYPYVPAHIWYFITYTTNMLPNAINNPLLHTWSLSVEEQFYLIWPLLIIFVNIRYVKYVFISAIIVGLLSKAVELYGLHGMGYSVFSNLETFGIGGLYAYARMNETRCARFEHYFKIIFALLLFIAWRTIPLRGLPVFVIYEKFLESTVALAIIIFIFNNQSPFLKKYLFENKTLNFIGKISYGIYLYHFTLGPGYDSFIYSLAQKHPSWPAFISNFYFSYCIKLMLLITVCTLSYKLIEQPILRFKKKFEYTG